MYVYSHCLFYARSYFFTYSASITTVDAVYDGFKSTLNVMVNITDGLPWPLKSVPQTFLYIIQLFEVCRTSSRSVNDPESIGTELPRHSSHDHHSLDRRPHVLDSGRAGFPGDFER